MKTENFHSLVGAFVVAGCAALAFVWNSGQSDSSNPEGYILTAAFSKADGIDVGSQVLLAGIPVGEVVKMDLDPNSYQVFVQMRVDDQIEIPIDSGAQITSDGIFGAKYISVDIGGEFDMHGPNGQFEFIRDSVIFEEVFETIIEMGEKGLAARKAQSTQSSNESSTNIFATDPSLLGPEARNSVSAESDSSPNTENSGSDVEDIFDLDSEDDQADNTANDKTGDGPI